MKQPCSHGFVRSSKVKCPYCDRQPATPKYPRNLAGIRFGKLVCVDIANKGVPAEAWRCLCDCKAVVVMSRQSLLKSAKLGHVSACPDCRAYAPPKPTDEHPHLDFPPAPEPVKAARVRIDRLGEYRLPGSTMFDTLSVLSAVASSFKLSIEELRGDERYQHFAQPRAAVYWLLVRHSIMSLSSIARTLGKRDHSTVVNGLRRCAGLRAKDTWYREQVDSIERDLEAKAKGEAAA